MGGGGGGGEGKVSTVERLAMGIPSQKVGVREKGTGDAVGEGVTGWGLL